MKKLMLFIFIPLSSFSQNWEFIGFYPADGRHHPITFSYEKFGFVIAGQNSAGEYLSDVLRYNAEQNTWEELSSFPVVVTLMVWQMNCMHILALDPIIMDIQQIGGDMIW